MDIASTSLKAIRNMAQRNLDSFLRRVMGELNVTVYFPKLRRSQTLPQNNNSWNYLFFITWTYSSFSRHDAVFSSCLHL